MGAESSGVQRFTPTPSDIRPPSCSSTPTSAEAPSSTHSGWCLLPTAGGRESLHLYSCGPHTEGQIYFYETLKEVMGCLNGILMNLHLDLKPKILTLGFLLYICRKHMIQVVLSEHIIQNVEGFEQIFNVSLVVRHYQYQHWTFDNDIMLLKVRDGWGVWGGVGCWYAHMGLIQWKSVFVAVGLVEVFEFELLYKVSHL